jgi:S-adenosylmethionine decarboxylase proenzyme
LNDAPRLAELLRTAAERAGARVLREAFHPFAPHGVTGVIVIEESHLSIHTWPEAAYAALDFFSCGQVRAIEAMQWLARELQAEQVELLEIQRGEAPSETLAIAHRGRLLLGSGPRDS